MPPTNKVGILSAAYTRLGQNPLSSFDEDSDAGRAAVANYEIIKKACLAMHEWRFAVSLQDVAANGQVESGYEGVGLYEYNIPPNSVAVLGQSDGNKLSRYRNRIYADTNSLKLVFIEDVGEEYFAPMFVDALATEIALRLCYATTQDNALKQSLTQDAARLWFAAKNEDMRQILPKSIEAALRAFDNKDTYPRYVSDSAELPDL